MLITCPSCSKKYSIKAQALGTKGRTVKCKNCGHKWFQNVPGAKAAAKAPPADAPPPFDQDDAMGAGLNGGGVDAGFENAAHIPDPPPIPDQLIQQDDDDAPARKGGLIGWLILLVTLSGISGAAVVFSDEIIEIFPESAVVYEAIGLHVPYVGEGLDLRELPTSRRDENGSDVLVISAEISNISEIDREIPVVQILLLNPLGKVVQTWLVRPPQPVLEPDGIITVSKEIRNPDPAATQMQLYFVDPRAIQERSAPTE